MDTGYYATFNRDNVELVDVSESPIEEITPSGLRAGDRAYDLDCIVFATGFDAMTGALLAISTSAAARAQPERCLGRRSPNLPGSGRGRFPNMFTITGPGSPSVLTNMVVSIEQHVNWIADCLEYLGDNGYRRIEATPEAQDGWVAYVNADRRLHLVPLVQLLVPGGECAGQAQGLHAAGGLSALRGEVCRRGDQGLRGLHHGPEPELAICGRPRRGPGRPGSTETTAITVLTFSLVAALVSRVSTTWVFWPWASYWARRRSAMSFWIGSRAAASAVLAAVAAAATWVRRVSAETATWVARVCGLGGGHLSGPVDRAHVHRTDGINAGCLGRAEPLVVVRPQVG